MGSSGQRHPHLEVGPPLGELGELAIHAGRFGDVRSTLLLGDGAASIARAHAHIDADAVPRVLASGDDWVALDVDAAATMASVRKRLPKASVPYAEGIALTQSLGHAIAPAHARGVTIGAIGPSHVLVRADGTFALIGFGLPRPWAALDAYAAASVMAGRPATPLTDLHATLLFLRSLVPWIAGVPRPLDRLLAGEAGALERTFQRSLFRVLGLAAPSDGAQALRQVETFWRTIGVTPDPEALGRRLAAVIRERAATRRLVMGEADEWFALDGVRVDLMRRRAARQVLRALVDRSPRSVSADELVVAGWPGERLVGSSGRDRLYVLLSTLRELGLRDAIVRADDGYALARDIEVLKSA